jgi:hypothetical protein
MKRNRDVTSAVLKDIKARQRLGVKKYGTKLKVRSDRSALQDLYEVNLENFYAFWREWFAQPEAAKLERSRLSGKGGYYQLGSESPGYSGKPDPKEYYHWRLKEGKFGGKETRDLFWHCQGVADGWLARRGLSTVIKACRPEDCVLRILHYPPTPDGHAGEAHRDFDLLTVSVPGTCPGLEVGEQEWLGDPLGRTDTVWYSQEEGIQVGEMLEIYTGANQVARPSTCNKQFAATLHRVRTPPNTERFKAVFFFLPPMDFELKPGFTARDYLSGPDGVLKKAGTFKQSENAR